MKTLLFIALFFLAENSSGQTFAWARQIGSPSADNGFTIKTDAQGNVYTSGVFTGPADFDPGPAVFTMGALGGQDVFISKLDSNGNFIWAKQFGGSGAGDAAVCYSLFIDGAGNIYLTGNFDGRVDFDPGPAMSNLQVMNASGTREIFVVKLNASGNLVWARQFGGASSFGLFSSSVAVDATGNVYTTGFFSASADFDPGPSNFNLSTINPNIQSCFISKLNAAGNFVWAKQIGDMRALCWSFGLALDNLGHLYFAGAFGASNLPVGTVDFDPGPGLTELTVPAANTNAFIVELDFSGIFLGVTPIDLAINDYARSIAIDGNNNVYYSGYNSNNNSDVFVGKIGSPGNSSWTKIMGGNGHEESHSISTDANGNIYVAGFFEQTVDFDPGPGLTNLTSNGDADLFAVKIDANGNFSWAINGGGSGTDAAYANAPDGYGSVYVTGIFNGQADMDPGPGSSLLNSNGGSDVFVLKLGRCGTNPIPDLGPDKQLCTGDSLTLSPGTFTSYAWQNGSILSSIRVGQAGIYSVTVTNNCGTATDQLIISEKDCAIYFPSGFSPNNDGRNDQFKILTGYIFSEFKLSVYNRWGEVIFTSTNPLKGWDGRVKGQVTDSGLFPWYCEYRKLGDSKLSIIRGTVLLIR